MSLSIVLLAYQEAENLAVLMPQINEVVQSLGIEYEILVVDSPKSTDNTREVAKQNNARYLIQEYPGYGGAFFSGIRHASMTHMLFLDSDGSHNPKDIPRVYETYQKGYDMVIGSRYVKGGISNDSKSSFLMSKLLNTTMRIIIGVKAKDISTSFRMYDAKQLKCLELTRENYDVLQEVILKQKINKRKKQQKFKIAEVPIVFNKRMYGVSKRQLLKFILDYIESVFIMGSMNIKSLLSDR